MQTHSDMMRDLMDAIGYRPSIYDREPARGGKWKPLREWEREKVDRVSSERGYRPMEVERVGR